MTPTEYVPQHLRILRRFNTKHAGLRTGLDRVGEEIRKEGIRGVHEPDSGGFRPGEAVGRAGRGLWAVAHAQQHS